MARRGTQTPGRSFDRAFVGAEILIILLANVLGALRAAADGLDVSFA